MSINSNNKIAMRKVESYLYISILIEETNKSLHKMKKEINAAK